MSKSIVPVKPSKHPIRYIKPKQMPIGDYIKGTFLYKMENVGNYGGEAYIILPKDYNGELIGLFSCKNLEYQMKYVTNGDNIVICHTETRAPSEDKIHPQYIFYVGAQ